MLVTGLFAEVSEILRAIPALQVAFVLRILFSAPGAAGNGRGDHGFFTSLVSFLAFFMSFSAAAFRVR